MMNINCKTIDSITVVRFENTDRFYVLNTEEAKTTLTMLLSQPEAKVIVNLENINFIDSSGFGVLLSALKKSKQNNSVIKICNMNQQVMQLFQLMKLDTIFETFEDIESCVASF